MDAVRRASRRVWREPRPTDLRAIEAEWPLIAAELAVVEDEIRAARAGDALDELSRRRMRRAASRRLRAVTSGPSGSGVEGLDDLDGFGGAA